MKHWLWPLAAAIAVIALGMMAYFGERDTRSESSFKAAGLMLSQAPATFTQVELSIGKQRWRFLRRGALWQIDTDHSHAASIGKISAEALSQRIDSALSLLQVSAPERMLSGEELTLISSFGLSPPTSYVQASAPSTPTRPFGIRFGRATMLEHARYAQVDGAPDVAIIPRHVADAWESLTDGL